MKLLLQRRQWQLLMLPPSTTKPLNRPILSQNDDLGSHQLTLLDLTYLAMEPFAVTPAADVDPAINSGSALGFDGGRPIA